MDLGIRGRSAIVCASSRGLGLACAQALAAEGVNVVVNGRDGDRLDKAVNELRDAGGSGRVVGVQADITTADGRNALFNSVPACDILINNNAGPKPHYFAELDAAGWIDAINHNMIPALLLTSAVLPGMRDRRFGRIVNITSAMVTTPRPHMASSVAPRAGLTGAMKALALEVARYNVTINNLLPERFDTDRQEFMAHETARREHITYDEARKRQIQSIAAGRLGEPKEFGAMCAFLCSSLAGYMSGLNIHMDGGSYPGLV
jgi:3-oxoacyl-[acyl-carrier protein] reductase